MRKKLKKQKMIAEILLVVGIISVITFTILFIKEPLFYFGIVAGLILIAFGSGIFKKLRETINEKLLPEVYETNLGTSYIHRPLEGFNSSNIYLTNLFTPQDRFFSHDLVSGEIYGFKYKLSEIEFLDTKSELKNFILSDVLFQGLFIEVNVESKIKESVYIVPKETTLHEYLGKEHLIAFNGELNNYFNVFSKAKKETKVLMETDFGKTLEEIIKTFPEIYIAVKKHAIYIGINSRKNPLSVRMFRPFDMSYLDKLDKELKVVKEIVYSLYKK